MTTATAPVLFDEAKLERLRENTASLGDVELIGLMANALAHAHVLAEAEHAAGLHNTLYCGDAAFNELAVRWIPADVWNEAAERFNRDEEADDAR